MNEKAHPLNIISLLMSASFIPGFTLKLVDLALCCQLLPYCYEESQSTLITDTCFLYILIL